MAEDKFSSKRKLVSGANAVVIIVVTIAIAIVANAISSQVFARFDLTENKIYTLSEASKDSVRGLDGPVEVRAFISPNLPPPFHNLSQQLGDLLSEYAAASDGRLTFQIINPDDDEETEEMARGFGIEKVAIGQQTETEISLRAVYKGIAFIKGEETEVIRDLHTTGRPEFDNFEYEFTKNLLNLRRAEPRRVAFLAGFGGPGAHPGFLQSVRPIFQQLYGNLIEVTSIDLSEDMATIPEDIHALVILNADQPITEQGKFAIDQFLQRGGNVGWFQSSSVIDVELQQQLMQQMQGMQQRMPEVRRPANTNLNSLFGFYGLEHGEDLIIDRERALSYSLVMTSRGLAQISHPGTFSLTDIDTSLPFTRNFGTLAFPVPASVTIRAAARERDSLEVFEVIKTAPSAMRRPEAPNQLSYEAFAEPSPTEEPGPFVVAAALQGRFPSYYEDNPLPAGISESDLHENNVEARLLVIGSGDFLQPNRQAGFDESLAGLGAQLFINSIEWLVQDNALTQIRGKAMPRLIGEVPRDQQRSIQFINIVVVPALFAALGALMMIRRRKRRENIRL